MDISGSVANLYNSQISSRGAALRQTLRSAGNWLVGATLFSNRQVRYQVSSAPFARPAPSSFGAAIAEQRSTPRTDLSRIRRLNSAQTASFVQRIYAHLPAFLVPPSYFYPQDLTRVKLSREDLQKLVGQGVTNFEGADFTGVNLDGMKLPGLNFTNAIFEACSFKETDISNCNCKGARFGRASLERTNASRVNFADADMRGAYFSDADMRGAYLNDFTLDGVTLNGVHFACATYVGKSVDNVILDAYSLNGLTQAGALLSGMKFKNLPGGFSSSIGAVPRQLDSSNFSFAKISDTKFEDRDLKKSDFTRSELRRLSFEKSDLTKSKFREAMVTDTSFSEASLRFSDFSEGKFLKVGFDKGRLREANFKYATIVETSFKDAQLADSNFSNANLKKVDFEKGVLTRANFERATIVETSFKDAEGSRLNFSNASLREVDFRGATFTDANFERALLWDCDLRGTNFSGLANFTNTDFRGSLIDRKGLQSLINAGAKTIHGVRLFGSIEGMDLNGVDLECTFNDDKQALRDVATLLATILGYNENAFGGRGTFHPDEEFVARVICEEISRVNNLTPARSLAELKQMGKIDLGEFEGLTDLSQRVLERIYRPGVFN